MELRLVVEDCIRRLLVANQDKTLPTILSQFGIFSLEPHSLVWLDACWEMTFCHLSFQITHNVNAEMHSTFIFDDLMWHLMAVQCLWILTFVFENTIADRLPFFLPHPVISCTYFENFSHLLCSQLFNLLIYASWMHCQCSIFHPPANWKVSSAVRNL